MPKTPNNQKTFYSLSTEKKRTQQIVDNTNQIVIVNRVLPTYLLKTGGVMTGALTVPIINVGQTINIAEKASAETPVAGYGQVWIKNDSPNTIWFTDDTGVDHQLGVGGGGSSPTTTKGDLIVHNGSADDRFPAGADNEIIQYDSAQPTGLKTTPIFQYGFLHLTTTEVQNHGTTVGTEKFVNWQGTPLATNTIDFTHSTVTNPSRIYVIADGRYSINSNISLDNTAAGRVSFMSRLRINGTTDIPRASQKDYSRGVTYGKRVQGGVITEIDLVAGDYFEVGTYMTDADAASTVNTIPAECEIVVRKLIDVNLTKGDAGANGADGGVATIFADAGTVIDLGNFLGNFYNYTTPNNSWWGTTFTFTGAVEAGWAKILIDTTGQVGFPALVGATAVTGHSFVAGRIFEMGVEYLGGVARYGFIDLYTA